MRGGAVEPGGERKSGARVIVDDGGAWRNAPFEPKHWRTPRHFRNGLSAIFAADKAIHSHQLA